MLVSKQQPGSCKQFAGDMAAFNPGVTGAVRAAETGDPVAFTVNPDAGAAEQSGDFSAEGTDTGPDIAMEGNGNISALQPDLAGSGHGADTGRPLAVCCDVQKAGGTDQRLAGE